MTSWRPFGSKIGSSNSRDQSVSRGIVIVVIAGLHTWRSIFVAGIARRAGHAGTAALTRMSAKPRLFGMILANLAAIVAPCALHCPSRISLRQMGDLPSQPLRRP